MKKRLTVIAALIAVGITCQAQVLLDGPALADPTSVKFKTEGFEQNLRQGTPESYVSAPVGTSLWFIQDTGGDGFIGASQGYLTVSQVNQIFNRDNTGDFDDFIMLTGSSTKMAGTSTALGATVNSFTLGASMDKTVDVYALLWWDVNTSNPIGGIGDSLGYVNLGPINSASIIPPEYVFTITDPLYSGTLTVVPEPATYGIVVGLALLGVAAHRRIRKKA